MAHVRSCPGLQSRSSCNQVWLGWRPCASQARGVSAVAVASSPTTSRPPRFTSKLRLKKLFEDTHKEMIKHDARVLDVSTLLAHSYYFRHPDDISTVLNKDDILFAKSSRVTRSKEWLGTGIFSQTDPQQHAAMRATMNPAFRMDYLKRLDAFMVGSALQLAAMLRTAAATKTGGDAGPLDMQHMFRLLTLDTIGLTSLNKSFDAMQKWQQQQQEQGSSGSGGGGSSSNSSGEQLDVEQLLWDLEAGFFWHSWQLPVPRSWLPGWSKYIRACQDLDSCIDNILAQVRSQQQQQQQGAQQPPSSSSQQASGSRATLVSFLLAAQQQQGAQQITDAMIRDEIKTILFGGTDTSSFTLAMCSHFLAQHPEAAERAAAEVRGLLQQSSRGDVSQLTAADLSKLPFVTACVNETMRLAPAGPVITRTATEDTELAGYHIPKGLSVSLNVYAMHRHPDYWPQPDAWLPQRWIPDEAAAAALTIRNTGSGSSNSRSQPFLPFSVGPRSCIGRNYALLQMVLTVAVLLGSGLRFGPALGSPPLDFAKGMTMHSTNGVWAVPLHVQ